MSDLVLATNTDDILAQLAAEFGVETEVPQSTSDRVYTNFSTLPDIRVLKSTWGSSEYLEWNAPGQDKVERFGKDFPYVNEIEGFIIHSEIQAGLQIENDDETSTRKTKTLCSVVGYKKGDDYVKELPERVSFNSMYEWDVTTNKPDYTSPNKKLKDLMPLGSRGTSCWDCITSGQSTKDWKGNEVGECKLRGRIFFYVTHLVNYFDGEKEVRSVQELTGEPGFVLMISLPTSTALKGKYDKKEADLIKKKELTYRDAEKTRQCYLGFLTGLYYLYNKKAPAKTNPKLVCTNISIKKPLADEKQPKNYLTFEEVLLYDQTLLRSALIKGTEVFPKKDPETLDPSNWVINGVGGSTVYASAKVEAYSEEGFPILEGAAVEEEYEQTIPF